MTRSNVVRVSTLIECVKAAHLSSYVQTSFGHQGGMMVVGPPGVMKTSIVHALDYYENALILSDVNTKMLTGIVKSSLTSNSVRSIVFPEFQRLFERDPRTASGVEGTIRALVEEGFSGASYEDPTVARFRAKAFVVAAMTDRFRDDNWTRWKDSGFARRFLWVLVRLKDPSILMRAVEEGTYAQVEDPITPMSIPLGTIPAINGVDRKRLRTFVRKQPDPQNVQYELLCRMASVLDFYYKRQKIKKNAFDTIEEFSSAILGGAELTGLTI